MRTVTLADGSTRWPAVGLGTWRLGEVRGTRRSEVAAVRTALELGYRLIDTAEMYGDGGAEKVVGEAVQDALRDGTCRRDELVIVSKVLPHHASARGTVEACERSLRRLRMDWIDLYLLHWPGPHPVAQTLAGFDRLLARGLVRRWGVSNFDTRAMVQLLAVHGGQACATNQVCYSLQERGIDFDLRPWQAALRMPLMAYCPLGQGSLVSDARLVAMAQRVGLSPAQLALAWALRDGDVVAIPKAVSVAHLRDNWLATGVRLDAPTLSELDVIFPPPRAAQPLAVV